LGDFIPHTSDVDFIVLTREDISDGQFTALQELHNLFDRSGSLWSKRIEAAYIPLAALNHLSSTTALYPQIEKGTELVRSPLEIGWAFQRHTLREHGIIVVGPSLRSMIDPVSKLEMRRTAATIIRGWQEQSQHDPSWIKWVRQKSSQALLVLTLCRIRYSLVTGSVVSSPAAGHWARAVCGPRWSLLIDYALTSSNDGQEISDADLSETLAFLDDTALLLM